jgi:succinylglutamic semialdehyde dehydrogenase
LILLRSVQNEEILTLLKDATKNIKVGVSDDCFIGPVVSNAAAENVMQVAARAMSLGGSEVLAPQRLDPTKPFIQPGIIDVTDVDKIDDEECFGPLLQVIWVNNLDEAIEVANNTRYGLSAGLLSDDKNDWDNFYKRIRAGIVNWNRPITGASGAAPFGGVGASGNFRPGAFYAADYSAYPIASMASSEVELPAQQSPGLNI